MRERRSRSVPSSRTPRERADRLPLFALATAFTVVLALGRSAGHVDVTAYRLLATLSPDLLHRIANGLDAGARIALATIVVAALAVDGRRWLDAVVGVLGIASGAFVGELAKTACERLRPSALPGTTTGNSFPSGHVMNTTLAAVLAWELADALPPRWRRAARVATVLAVGAQGTARVFHGSHWPSDVVPSILLGVTWMLAAERLAWLPRWRVALASTGAAAYVVFLTVPAVRFHLLSAMDRPRVAVAIWDASSALVPAGSEDAAPAADGASWSRTLRSPTTTPDALELVMAARCRDETERCRRVRLSVNGAHAVELALHCGWHWYSAGAEELGLRRGNNEIVLRPPAGCPRPALAVQSLALVVDRDSPRGGDQGIAAAGPHA